MLVFSYALCSNVTEPILGNVIVSAAHRARHSLWPQGVHLVYYSE